ncbi:MAG: RsmF rRNA methyltransferase first C-terminal domain-containing protein [Lachnospiraceae bacterium]|nr:RsmF rRNA methyltransferase first C-terminal domain-containing protein [Lachnospiraceae bacterium]
MNLPKLYEDRMKNMLGSEYADYEASLAEPFIHGLRVNTKKISVEDFLKISPFELEPVPWCENGFYILDEKRPSKHPYYFAGLYYLQEPSAMIPAALMPIDPGDKVIDICAAPGGKSTELGAKLNGSGFLLSNDISASRAKALLKNLEVFGIGNMAVSSESVNVLADRFPCFFDKILIDAPCSGEGMFRKSSSMITAWERNGVELFVGLQKSILKDAVKMLAPGGVMIYSTCTFSPEEDEQSIEYLLSLDDSLSLCELPLFDGFVPGKPEWGESQNVELSKTRRLFPHKLRGEGHFVAMVKKSENADDGFVGVNPYRFKSAKLSSEAKEFFKSVKIDLDLKRIESFGGRLYYIGKDAPDVGGLRLLRNGLLLGEEKKNRFEPSEALAMALKVDEFDNVLDLPADDIRVTKYLKGETIEGEGNNGYILICVDGYPLGFGKLNKGIVKNKYLPGWRMN